ncbi:hypothetical protein, partial [Klebsiella variicola]
MTLAATQPDIFKGIVGNRTTSLESGRFLHVMKRKSNPEGHLLRGGNHINADYTLTSIKYRFHCRTGSYNQMRMELRADYSLHSFLLMEITMKSKCFIIVLI